MAKAKKKGDKKDDDPVKLSEFEQKALEILDTSSLKEIITTYKSRVDDLVKDIYDLNDRIKNSNEENVIYC